MWKKVENRMRAEKAAHRLAAARAPARLQPGDTFLDIGCGWGGLVTYASEKYGVRARGITLSDAQLEVARKRIRKKGLEDRVTVEIKDYAHLDGTFNKIASIGMYEHIGVANIPDEAGTAVITRE
jgi:cyclopropane-fatty-acyl-phospholipid synthase